MTDKPTNVMTQVEMLEYRETIVVETIRELESFFDRWNALEEM
jgi:hypothetical protein